MPTRSKPHRFHRRGSRSASQLKRRLSRVGAHAGKLLGLSVLLLLGVVAWWYNHWQTWQCLGVEHEACPEELTQAVAQNLSNTVLGNLIYLPDRLQADYPATSWIGMSYGVNRQLDLYWFWPSPRVWVTSASLSQSGKGYQTSFSGYLLTQSENPDLPVLQLDKLTVLPGQQLLDYQTKAVELVYYLNQLNYQFSAQVIDQYQMKAQLFQPKLTVWFSLRPSAEPEVQVSSLQLILRQTKMDDEVREIDLRFKNPVIRQ